MKRRVRPDRILALCVLLLAPLRGNSDEAWGIQHLMDALAQIPAAKASFREEKTLAMLDVPLVLEGWLYYKAPNYLKKQVIKPHLETFEVEGGRLLLNHDRDGPRELQLRDYPLLQALLEAFRATFAGDLASLQEHYHIALKGSAADWRLRLEPRDKTLAGRIRALTLKGAESRIYVVETLEVGGDLTVMKLQPRP